MLLVLFENVVNLYGITNSPAFVIAVISPSITSPTFRYEVSTSSIILFLRPPKDLLSNLTL